MAAILNISHQESGDDTMIYRSITVIIPPEMSDCDECYKEVTEYVAACTGFGRIQGDADDEDSLSCEAYFVDDKGNIWRGQLSDLPFPDGSQKYTIDLEKKREEH
jgi:hypothetical protein